MQHGNSASSLKPLHVFQVTGKLLKGLNDLIVSSIQLKFKPTSVKSFVFNNEATRSCVTDSIGSLSILVLLATTQFLVYYATQNFCISKNFTFQKSISLYHMNIITRGITNESRCNKLLGPLNLQHFLNNISYHQGLLKCESNSFKAQKR